MLSTMRTSWLLFAVLALAALSSALSIEEVIRLDGIEAYLHHGEKRQATGTGSTTTEPSATPTDRETTTPPPDTPTTEPPTSTTPTREPTTSDEQTPTTAPTTSAQQTSTRPPPTTTPTSADAPPPSKTPTPFTTTRALTTTSTQEFTSTFLTVSDSKTLEVVSTGTSTWTSTSSIVQTTSALPQDGSSSGSGGGGLSDNSKKIIGGVVGGVGGAILLGGIALVCWRIWGRKNRVAEDDADLMANTGAALGDKSQNNASPFQSNLEQYHNPGGRPNAAANF